MRYRILIIEGEPVLRGNLVSAFTKAGFVTADVSDYWRALLKLESFRPDMVIMEAAQPDRDGLEACSTLHGIFQIPVILLGEDTSGKMWRKAVEAGADFYQIKPSLCNEELVARVRAILRRYNHSGSKRRLLQAG